ncbi:MAG: hypothetical protein Q4B13_05555 [Lautropia sp.]|nr:hypothetical protein [Lautropia sp.]
METNFVVVRSRAATGSPVGRAEMAQASRARRSLARPLVAMSGAALVLGAALLAGSVQAETVTRIYQSRMHDGSLSFGDRPAQDAVETERHDYRLPDAPAASTLEAERLKWAEQNRAFEQRYTDRLAIESAQARQRGLEALLKRIALGASADGVTPYPLIWGALSPAQSLTPTGSIIYRSSPGAVNGRAAPFLSSGFQAHPVN